MNADKKYHVLIIDCDCSWRFVRSLKLLRQDSSNRFNRTRYYLVVHAARKPTDKFSSRRGMESYQRIELLLLCSGIYFILYYAGYVHSEFYIILPNPSIYLIFISFYLFSFLRYYITKHKYFISFQLIFNYSADFYPLFIAGETFMFISFPVNLFKLFAGENNK